MSVDPKRVYVADPAAAPTGVTGAKLRTEQGERGPDGEEYCWWQVRRALSNPYLGPCLSLSSPYLAPI